MLTLYDSFYVYVGSVYKMTMNIILVSGLATVLSCPVVFYKLISIEHHRHLTLSDKTPELIIFCHVFISYILASHKKKENCIKIVGRRNVYKKI